MTSNKKYTFELTSIGSLFFIFGFITWINSTLIPFLKITCELTNFQAYWVTFAFYISYFVMALPSGWLLYRIGFRRGIMLGLLTMGLGTLMFIPAALARNYGYFLGGLFTQGIGLALLQTAVNPYVTILGPIESAARRISIMGLSNKLAGIISPYVLGSIVLHNISLWVEQIETVSGSQKIELLNMLSYRIIAPYLVMAFVLLGLALIFGRLHLAEVKTEDSQRVYPLDIFKYPQIILGFFAIFFYVGAEVVAADTLILHGHAEGIAMETARIFPSITLLAMMMGYLGGIVLIPKYVTQQAALAASAVLGLCFTSCAIIFSGWTSVFFVMLLGLANAIMWPAIWPLSIDGTGNLVKLASSILIMGILGGALVPLGYGWLADRLGSQLAYLILLPCYGYILFFALRSFRNKRIV
ncbi:MAG: sugar MFS transporter [Bacteroidales bacterium]